MSTHAQAARVRVFRALHEIAVAVGGVLEPVELARLVVDRACELLGADAVGLYVVDDAHELRPICSSDARPGVPEPTIPAGVGAAGQAFVRGKPVLVDDYPSWPHAGHWAAARGVRSALAVPLQANERRTGAVSVRTYMPRHWTAQDAQTLTLLAAQIAPVLEAARLHERTRQARLQAEAAIKLRDEVLAGVSHDLAGPLARIRLYAEMIQSETPGLDPADSAQQLAAWSTRIVAATASMKSVIQELLEVARLQIGQAHQLDLSRTDLVGLAHRAVAEHQQSGRLIRLAAPPEPLVGWWDQARLARVLANLLENALKYSPSQAEVVVSVDLSHSDGQEWAVVRVRDRGLGIPPEDLPHVFDRYYRGSNVGDQASGGGLGLAVARQIAHQHVGTLEIASQLGQGTLATLRLPLTPPPEGQ